MKRALVLAALLLAACFNVDERPCSYACGPAGQCPDDYMCLSDGYCHLHGNPQACGYSDLAVPDLSMDLSTGGDGPVTGDGPGTD